MSRPNSKKYSGNKIEIKIELTYAFSNIIPVWDPGRSVITQRGRKSQRVLISVKNKLFRDFAVSLLFIKTTGLSPEFSEAFQKER